MKKLPKIRERGMSLVVALIGLAAMTIVGLALMRSVQTASQIAGNYAFHTASMHAADSGLESAQAALDLIAASSVEIPYPASCTTNCYYFPVLQTLDANGVPSGVNWSALTAVTINTDFKARYVIERMCSGSLPISNVPSNCFIESVGGGGTQKAGGTSFSTAGKVYFRTTVRIDGPRNTVAYVQTVVSH